MSFFNKKNWRVKFRNSLGDFPVHYAALFINRTINNNYMTLSMALHHTHDRLWNFLGATRASITPGTLPTLNLSVRSHPSSGNCLFLDVISVTNDHSYKEKTVKLLPYHSFYWSKTPQEKLSPLFWQSASKKYKVTRIPI